MAIAPPVRNRVFADLVVLELGDEGTQACGRFFADMGATVVKVEPLRGVGARTHGPFKDEVEDHDRCLYFWAHNTSKESITLDLSTEAGQAKFRELADRADVILEEMGQAELATIGLSFEDLASTNPGLIMTSVSPFGPDGPLADWKSSDMVNMAMGGAMWNLGYDDPGTPPLIPQGDLSFQVAGLWASIGTIAALMARASTGEGQHVDISMQETTAFLVHCYNTVHYQYQGTVIHRHDYVPTVIAGDGRRVLPQILNVASEKWLAFRDWLLEQGAGEDLRSMDAATLEANMGAVRSALAEVASTMPASDLIDVGQGFGMTWAAVNAPEELVANEQLIARGFFQNVDHPELASSYTYAGNAAIWSEGSGSIWHRAPLLGEHNAKWGIG